MFSIKIFFKEFHLEYVLFFSFFTNSILTLGWPKIFLEAPIEKKLHFIKLMFFSIFKVYKKKIMSQIMDFHLSFEETLGRLGIE